MRVILVLAVVFLMAAALAVAIFLQMRKSDPAATVEVLQERRAELKDFPRATTDSCIIVCKAERRLSYYADKSLVKTWPMTAFSGQLGPKRAQGDLQIPEGMYRITLLNPQSSYHLSMRLNYPNANDLAYAEAHGIEDPGDDIYIHGKAVTIGCVPIGDTGIEELFYLVEKSAVETRVIMCPVDFRERDVAGELPDLPRYAALRDALRQYP